jgi:hypothetical protein
MALSVTQDATGIRRFSDDKIQAAVERALLLRGDRPFAVVAHADLDGAALSVVGKIGDKWSVVASCYKPYQGKLAAEAEVVWTPF